MATLLENLIARRDAIGEELAELANNKAGGKPNYSGANSIDHVGYKDGLYRELEQLNNQIAAHQGPVEIVTYGIV